MGLLAGPERVVTTLAPRGYPHNTGLGLLNTVPTPQAKTRLYVMGGPAPYYTVIAPGRAGVELEQWDAVKAAASAAIHAAGGTATHHHAVGRDHRPSYDRERPDL